MEGGKRGVVFCDLDGTLYSGHIWQALKRHHEAHRTKLPTLYFYLYGHMALGSIYRLKLLSEEAFFRLWAEDLAWLVRGLTAPQAQEVFSWVIDEDVVPKLRADVLARLRDHQAQGEPVILLSGTFQPLLDMIATRLGLDGALGTELVLRDGRYNGRIAAPLCLGEGKASRLDGYVKAHPEADLAACTAYGDSSYDLPVFERVGHPVAVYPEPRLAAIATERGWPVIGTPKERD